MKNIWIRDKDDKLQHAEPTEVDMEMFYCKVVVWIISLALVAIGVFEASDYYNWWGF